MNNQEIINYIMKTPQNTNPEILRQKLEEQDFENRSDWNQNNEKAPDFIKNRPFYEQLGEVLFDNDIELLFYPMGAGESIAGIEVSKLPIVGTKYLVTIDEETLECVCEQDRNMLILRNMQFSFGQVYIWHNTLTGYTEIQAYVNYSNKACHLRIAEKGIIQKIDPKYLPENDNSPYVIDSEAYTYGDDALAAILEGRQILIKVPNKNEGTLYSNFMPVIQYQLPNVNNNYLILFYLKDGIAENLLTAMQTGSFGDIYGVIEMMLSKTYTECPLKVDPIK